ncbi:hypothetical protein EXU57_14325 [Segetibacter sp. 3557_3]|uniref:hypothetical protein n=1 Tax=Segetibacter sp. 3557_3 TaxID=2547429 RepID=UPI0010591670|nr:hypothetical protein [Segetibacter sp. 3557_3]TDH25276.1 hypothetical protein EXU57_14325 [Segetibacter sp. 3557_3]
MKHDFPMEFTLESGTHVKVTQTDPGTYAFSLLNTDKVADNFVYVEDDRSRDEIEEGLDFDQLNALRTFWLKTTEVI